MKVGDVTVLFLFYIRTLNTSYDRRIKFKGGFRDEKYISKNCSSIYNVVVNTANDSRQGY